LQEFLPRSIGIGRTVCGLSENGVATEQQDNHAGCGEVEGFHSSTLVQLFDASSRFCEAIKGLRFHLLVW
jgi:hypothetical protein